MKYKAAFIILLFYCCSSVSSAPFLSSMRNADKLTFLDKHGYEVISDAEEILTPVSASDNSVNLSAGETLSKPNLLLYGRFYVLRQRGLLNNKNRNVIQSETFPKNYPAAVQRYFQYRTGISQRSTITTISPSEFMHKQQRQTHSSDASKQENDEDDSIFFPTEASIPTKKQYIRRIKDGTIPPEVHEHGRKYLNLRRDGDEKKKRQDSTTENPEEVSEEINENFENMNSEEFISWARENLDSEQIGNLVQETIAEDEEDTTPTTLLEDSHDGIQYNSFILVPSLKCPEGQRPNHRGICTQKYVHNSSPRELVLLKNRANRVNTNRKLVELLKTLKAMELDVESALEKENQKSDSSPETTHFPSL